MYIIREYNIFQEEIQDLSGIAIIVDNKKLCLVLPKKFKGKNKYSIPKGHVEKDKTAYQSAYHELKEETGISLGLRSHDDTFKYSYRKNGVKKHLQVFVFHLTKQEFEELERGNKDHKEISKVVLAKKKKSLKLVEPIFKKLVRYLFR